MSAENTRPRVSCHSSLGLTISTCVAIRHVPPFRRAWLLRRWRCGNRRSD
jgi:hypothetical protein